MPLRLSNRSMIIMLAGVLIVFGGIFGFKAWLNAFLTDLFDNLPPPIAAVTVSEVRTMAWQPQLEAVGDLAAVQGTMLTLEVGGVVDEILFASGSRVAAGDVLLRLDTRTEQALLERLEATSELAALELARAERLAEQNNISVADLQRRQTEARQARAAVQEQQARINQKVLRAPFAGELGIRQVNQGQFVNAGEPIVSLQTRDQLHVNFSVAERHARHVYSGQHFVLHTATREEPLDGELIAIEPSVAAGSRTLALQGLVDNADGLLRSGMFGRVSLDMGEVADVLVLPQSAVRFQPYGELVYTIREDEEGAVRAYQRLVRTGERRGDLVIILEGLEAGERVATSGLLKLRNEGVVEIIDDPAVNPPEELMPTPIDS